MEIYDSLMAIYDKIILCLIDNHLWPFPSAKRKFIYDHLWLHWLKFMIISSAKRKTIHEHLCLHWLNFMTISSAKRKFIYDHLWFHWWSFLTKKSAKRKTIYDHLWLHWCSFLTKKKRGAQNQYLIDIIFDKEKPIQVKNLWVILNPGQKGLRGSRSQCPTINALGYRLCKSPSNKFRALFCSKVRVSWGDLPSAASPPTYATPIECALWYLQCAPTIASGLPLSIVPSVGIT